ncbi:MAG: phosphatidylserine decarboxylase family protein [Chloroflexota bacterium]
MKPDKPIAGWAFKKSHDGSIRITTLILILMIMVALKQPNLLNIVLLIIILAIWLLVLYFFRNPDRAVLDKPGLIIGPCDGTVADISQIREEQFLKADTIRIGIFLSVFNVHVQRAPIEGEVTLVQHQPGKFLPAFNPKASEENEYIAMRIATEYGTMLVKQISGILARRCVNYANLGDKLLTGQRFGLIKFGSRVELFLPPEAEILVSVGDIVEGGLTKIAQMSNPRSNHEK